MITKGTSILVVLVCVILFCAGPVNAAITSISQGNTVFIGEEGLDISAAMGPATQIGWWAPAAEISTTSPGKTIVLTGRITNFIVTPSEFSGYTGNWYRLNNQGKLDGFAFVVADPQIEIKAEDTTIGVNPPNNWIPTGDDIQFRIDSNLAQMAFQRGSPPPVTIHVQSPGGAEYSALYDANGIPTSIIDIPVTSTPYVTGPIWNMGNPGLYPYGTYTYWAESNVNHMNDNYNVEGKTISKKSPLLNQGANPLISTATTITAPNTQIPTQVTTQATTPARTMITPQTTVSTVVQTPPPTPSPTTSATLIPSPSQTQAPGFGVPLAISAILFGLIVFLKKE
jgi:cell division septation protein DedD